MTSLKNKKKKDNFKSNFFSNKLYQKLFLLVCSFFIYANSLKNDYNIDDGLYHSSNNSFIQKGLNGIGDIFTNPTFFLPDGTKQDFRPTTAITFALQYQIFGDSAFWGHFINLVLYLLTVVLLLNLLNKWTLNEYKELVFFAVLLFAIHPLHTEVVNNIKCRDELLALLLSILALQQFFTFLESKKIINILIASGLFLLALLAKNTATTFLLIFPLSAYFFSKTPIRKIAIYTIPLMAVYFLLSFYEDAFQLNTNRVFKHEENPFAVISYAFSEKLATSLSIMLKYFQLHIIPHPLIYYYGTGQVPVITLKSMAAILSILLHIGLIILAILNTKKNNIIGFAIWLYLINILVFSNLIELAPGLMAERFTYAASIGFCIVFTALLHFIISRNPSNKWYAFAIFSVITIGFCIIVINRNQYWENKEILYAHDIQYQENSARANLLYGDLLFEKAQLAKKQAIQSFGYNKSLAKELETEANRNFKDAKAHFEKAYQIAYADTSITYKIAEVNFQLEHFAENVQLLSQHTNRLNNNDYHNFILAMNYQKLNKFDSAIKYLEKAIHINKHNIVVYEQLNRLYLKVDQENKIVPLLQKAITQNPTSPLPYAEMANYYLIKKDTATALVYCKLAIKYPPINEAIVQFIKLHNK
ncbi:MAG: tetratricopeptide repeat protein [Chitinophagaceae bacterium]